MKVYRYSMKKSKWVEARRRKSTPLEYTTRCKEPAVVVSNGTVITGNAWAMRMDEVLRDITSEGIEQAFA